MISSFNAKEIEESALKLWEKERIYHKATEKNKDGKNFYFLDGPPYTSGRIHIGQAWNKSLKDCVLRYRRMQGFKVWDRAGYDMHGLPTEHKVMEKLGLKSKDEIPAYGLGKYTAECKKISSDFLQLMNKDFIRLGVWMDFENAYQSINSSFMEGEWWLIKKAHENKRLYEGEKTMHWCAHCATALAKHELEYETITDTSVFVKYPIKGKHDEYLIIWTTTPWTLAFNLAVMVHPELEYVKIKVDDEKWIVAKGLVGPFMGSVVNKKFEIIEEFTGEKLEGLRYTHPWAGEIAPFKSLQSEKLHSVVLSSEYVDLSAGSGLVHCAPGCGPEDYEVGYRNKLPPFNNISEQGVFPKEMGKFANLRAKINDKDFIAALGDNLIAKTPVEHEYAHCWRCHKPVIFRTTKQWFFKVEDLIEEMKQLNKKVFWQPGWAGSNWFDSWLNNLRDNGITRQRYWGTPLPVWRCDKCGHYDVIGSVKELKEKAGKVPEDLHRPWIDEITYECSCGGIKSRISDILDVWIDSGTASWTCLDYPQKEDLFKKLWPADFILEGKDQIRGWFNLLLVASMVSMQKHSYKACYMHGFVQDSQGRKMSKSLGNIISPYEVIDKLGADTLRYYMIGGANPGIDINYNEEDTKLKHKNLIVLWNLHKFLIDYANSVGVSPNKLKEGSLAIEEEYILSKLHSTIRDATNLFEEYRLNEVPLVIEKLFLELSRTYVQLVRDKSSIGSEDEKKTVLYAVYHVLIETLKMFATIVPFTSEAIYQNLKQEFNLKEESIHLCDWPKADPALIKDELEEQMDIISNIIQAGLAARDKVSLGVRWPVSEIIITTKDEKTIAAVRKLSNILKKQLNAKHISIQSSLVGLRTKLKADYKKLGPDFGKNAPRIIAKLTIESSDAILSTIEKEGKFRLKVDDERFDITKDHLIVEREVPEPYQESPLKSGFLYLNKKLDEELEAEGFAREIMRRIQSLRKDNGLQKSDSISLFIRTDEDLAEVLAKHEKTIADKVGASILKISEATPAKKHAVTSKEQIKGKEFEIFFDKV